MTPDTIPPVPSTALPVDEDDPSSIPPEVLPDLEQFVIDDGKPVDNIFTEKQYRLLTATLYHGWAGPGEGHTFQVFSDVGLHFGVGQPSLSPDVMLAIDAPQGSDLSKRENRSYFIWLRGKAPDLVLEIVSDRLDGELTHKRDTYARWGIPNYVVFDPMGRLRGEILQSFGLERGKYVPLSEHHFPAVKLGLKLWKGTFEDMFAPHWLRWCDETGTLIPTAAERIPRAERRAEEAERRADDEKRRADDEKRRADDERLRREKLEARLRELGIEP